MPVSLTDIGIFAGSTRITVKTETETIVLPYLGKLSLEIRKRIRKYVNKHITNCNLVVIFRSQRRLRTPFRYKDTIPPNL